MGHLTLTRTDTKSKSHMHTWVWVPLYISMVTQILMGWFVIHTVLVVTESVETHSNSLFSLKSAPNDFK